MEATRAATTPIIGRSGELRRLAFVINDPARNLVILRGAAGAGKTALANAALARAQGEGALIGRGKYTEGDVQSPYQPILQALSEAVSQALDALYEPAPVLAGLEALGPAAEVLRRAGLDGLFGPSPVVIGATGRRASIALLTDAVLHLVRWLEGFNLPIVLLIDDWRRNAPESRAVLASLLSESAGRRFTVVVTERDVEPPHDLAAMPGAVTLDIDGLRPADRLALLVNLLGEGGGAVHAWLGDAGGMDLPFDICTLARAVADAGALTLEEGVWRVVPELASGLDGGARRAAGQLRNLGPSARQVALALAVWGDNALADGLRDGLGLAPSRFEAALHTLEDLGVVRRRGDRIEFAHDRFREQALAEPADDPAVLAAAMADRLARRSAPDWPAVAYAALHLRQAGGLAGADPELWRDRFAQGSLDARRRLDASAASGFAESALQLRTRAAPACADAERLILGEAMMAAADRRAPAEVMERAGLLVSSARSDSELGEDHEHAVAALRASGAPDLTWAFAKSALARYGLKAPDRVGLAPLLMASWIWRRARRRAPDDALDGELDGLTRTAHAAAVAAFERSPAIAVYITCHAAARVRRRRRDAAFWSSVDVFLSSVFGDFAGAARLGAHALTQLNDDSVFRAATLYRALYFGQIWVRPMAELRPACAKVQELALLEGDLGTSAIATRNKALIAWRTHRSLPEMKTELMEAMREANRLGDADMIEDIEAFIPVVEALLQPGGEALAHLSPRTVPALEGSPILMLELAGLQGDWPRAVELAERVASRRRGYDSHPGGVVWRFHETLARLKSGRAARRRDLAFIRKAAALNPHDHGPKLLILEAEQLRVRGHSSASLAAYAEATRAATATAGPLEAGLAAECAADAARKANRPDLADYYAGEASRIWGDWGAAAKLEIPAEAPLAARLAAVESQARKAEREGRAKSRFLADVAHELRTPLQAMQGLLDLAADEPAALDLTVLREVFGSLKTVIDDLTDFGALASGETRVTLAPVAIADLVRSEVAIFAPLAGGGLQVAIADDVPAWAETDGARVRQIVRNLLSNAFKYGQGAPVAVSVRRDAWGPDSDQLVVAVDDSGPGLSEADLRLVFEPFERGAHAGDGLGLGLGLALSRRIAETLGGALQAENREEGGARFTFRMPMHPAAESAPREASAQRPLNILLAEDVDLVRKVIAANLRRVGHTVQEAADGGSAWRLYRRHAFDLAIVDWAMPGLDGGALLKRMEGAGARPKPPVIVLTASSDTLITTHARTAGAAMTLRKPVSAAELSQAIATVCGVASADSTLEGAYRDEMSELRRGARLELERRVAALLARWRVGEPLDAREAHRLAGLAAQFDWPALAEAADALEQVLRHEPAGLDLAMSGLEQARSATLPGAAD